MVPSGSAVRADYEKRVTSPKLIVPENTESVEHAAQEYLDIPFPDFTEFEF